MRTESLSLAIFVVALTLLSTSPLTAQSKGQGDSAPTRERPKVEQPAAGGEKGERGERGRSLPTARPSRGDAPQRRPQLIRRAPSATPAISAEPAPHIYWKEHAEFEARLDRDCARRSAEKRRDPEWQSQVRLQCEQEHLRWHQQKGLDHEGRPIRSHKP